MGGLRWTNRMNLRWTDGACNNSMNTTVLIAMARRGDLNKANIKYYKMKLTYDIDFLIF